MLREGSVTDIAITRITILHVYPIWNIINFILQDVNKNLKPRPYRYSEFHHAYKGSPQIISSEDCLCRHESNGNVLVLNSFLTSCRIPLLLLALSTVFSQLGITDVNLILHTETRQNTVGSRESYNTLVDSDSTRIIIHVHVPVS